MAALPWLPVCGALQRAGNSCMLANGDMREASAHTPCLLAKAQAQVHNPQARMEAGRLRALLSQQYQGKSVEES